MTHLSLGVIVDGHGDHAALTEKLKGKARVLKTSGPRGHTVDAKALAASAAKEIDMLIGLGCTRICVLTDREMRSDSSMEFSSAIQRCLPVQSGNASVFVACADRMIENWMLADIVHVAKNSNDLKRGLKQKRWEGTHGKNEIKRCMDKNASYNEVKHGKKFLLAIRDGVARANSASYDTFLRKILL